MCCKTAKWKREKRTDHKFDFVDVQQFCQHSLISKLKYSFLYLVVAKSVLVYIADLWTAGILLIFDQWSNSVKPKIPFEISKWVFLGCIFMSFVLLAIDMKKARKIYQSRDISIAFTNIIAYRSYTLRSYAHFCFFSQINNSKKKWDNIAFFVFFTFKGWKRLVLAEAPRQAINAFTLYSILQTEHLSLNIQDYGDNLVQKLAMSLMAFTLLVFVGSATLLVIAFILYFPLLCHIRGNLKEYLCHKIDKRISELLKKKRKDRLKEHLREQQSLANDPVASKRKKNQNLNNNNVLRPIREPTLPQLEIRMDDDAVSSSSFGGGVAPPPPYHNLPPGAYGGKHMEAYAPGGYGQRGNPYGPGAAGQRPPMNAPSEMMGYPGYGPQAKRSYGNLQAPMNAPVKQMVPTAVPLEKLRVPHVPGPASVSDYGDDYEEEVPFGGTVDNYTSEYGDPNPAGVYQYSAPSVPVPRQQPYAYRPGPPAQPPMGEYDFRPPPPVRSGSPTPSVGSTGSRGSGRGSTVPARYAQDQRVPRYNNYTQQGGRQMGGGRG